MWGCVCGQGEGRGGILGIPTGKALNNKLPFPLKHLIHNLDASSSIEGQSKD